MSLSIKEVEHIARLARIELTEQEKEKFATQLSAIFDYIAQLKEVDTSRTEPTAQVTGLENITRVDAVKSSDPETREKILDAAPMREGDYLKVKAVFE